MFKYQAESALHLTVTDPDMTRFVMTLDDSVSLIQTALTSGTNGDIWIPKPPSMRIGDLADIFAKLANKPVKTIGVRPGEKKHEDLINESESIRTTHSGNHFVIKPATQVIDKPKKSFTYSSNDNVLSKDDLLKHLTTLGIIDASLDTFVGASIEEIITNRK